MTLKPLKPATINTIKLFAFILIALGIAGLAHQAPKSTHVGYVSDLRVPDVMPESIRLPGIMTVAAWLSGFILLIVNCQRKQVRKVHSFEALGLVHERTISADRQNTGPG
jgi:hypothetical protein